MNPLLVFDKSSKVIQGSISNLSLDFFFKEMCLNVRKGHQLFARHCLDSTKALTDMESRPKDSAISSCWVLQSPQHLKSPRSQLVTVLGSGSLKARMSLTFEILLKCCSDIFSSLLHYAYIRA